MAEKAEGGSTFKIKCAAENHLLVNFHGAYKPDGIIRTRPDMIIRAAELSKFVLYESPLTVVCDHPDNILNQPGADFLKIVPTTWDDIRILGGYPGWH